MNRQLLVVCLLVFFSVLGFIQLNVPFSQWQLTEAYPPVRNTVDVFIYTMHQRMVYETEDAVHLSRAIAGLEKVVIANPLLIPIFTASLNKLTDVHPNHMAWVLIVLVSIFVPITFFVLVRRVFNDKVALLTLVLGLFAEPFWYFKTYIGHWGDVISFFFVPGILFFLYLAHKQKPKVNAILIALLIAAMFFAHGSEFLYMLVFCGGWFVLNSVVRKDWKKLLPLGVMVVVFMLLILYILPLMAFRLNPTHIAAAVGSNSRIPGYYPRINFNWIQIVFITIGVGSFLLLALSKKIRTGHLLILAFIAFLVLVSSTYPLMGYRIYRQYYSAYFLAVVIIAFGAYFLLHQVLRKTNLLSWEWLVIISIVLVLGVMLFQNNYNHFGQQAQGSIADRKQWEAIMWTKSNTPEDAIILNFNGFIHAFPEFWNDRNMAHMQMHMDSHLENFKRLCSGIYPEEIYASCGQFGTGLDPGVYITKRTGWNSFEFSKGPFCADYPAQEIEGFRERASIIPLTYFDYIMVQYSGTGRWIGQNYDGCIAFFLNESLARGHELVWSNEKMAVLKVNKNATRA